MNNDDGREFIERLLDLWVYENDVTLDFSRLGKPAYNPYQSLSDRSPKGAVSEHLPA